MFEHTGSLNGDRSSVCITSDARTLSLCVKTGGVNVGADYGGGSRAGDGALVIMALLGAFLCLSYVVWICIVL